jgi:hypothetical protein
VHYLSQIHSVPAAPSAATKYPALEAHIHVYGDQDRVGLLIWEVFLMRWKVQQKAQIILNISNIVLTVTTT